MKNNTQEKNLIKKDDNNFIGKIKNFFSKIFSKKIENSENKEIKQFEDIKEQSFKDNIKKIVDDEEIELLELQRRYRKGEVADSELSQEQINSLCQLYDKQIEDLKRTIGAKEQQVAKYKKIL